MIPPIFHRYFSRQAGRSPHGLGLLALALLSTGLALFLSLGPARKGPAASVIGENSLHDPSRITLCNGKYYVYGTGPGISGRVSTDLIHWTRGPSVLDHVPDWAHQAVPKASGDFVWAPDVLLLNGKYDLFYSYSTFGSRVSVIGLVTSPTLDPDSPNYHWTDQGQVVASNTQSAFNTIDPCPILDAQGRLWLSFGSWNQGGIQLVELDKNTGKPISGFTPLAQKQKTGPEASYLHYHDGYYYLFENEGLCCQGMNSTYQVMMGRSKTITGPYTDKAGKDLRLAGGTLFLGSNGERIGPGCIGILHEDDLDRVTFHYYNGLENGRPTLGLETLIWGADGWPQAGTDLPSGRYSIVSKASGLALGVQNGSRADGTPIDQSAYRREPSQQWNVTPTGDGYYGLASVGTGKYLDLFGCSPKDGTKIDQYPWLNNDCQRWRIEQTSDGAYRLIAKGGGTAITVSGGTKTPQAGVEGDAWKGNQSQEWIFQKL
jgi:arabinan endo-1,5-alpha-L-arabinosidase